MKIHNVRLGHATNSSSSHSMIFVGKNGSFSDDGLGGVEGGEFGWSDFTLVSPEAKKLYVGAMIYTSLKGRVSDPVAKMIAESLCGTPVDEGSYVDHQSVVSFPTDWRGKDIDLDFAREWTAHVMRDDVVVLGGNDNSDGHPLKGSGEKAMPHVVIEGENPVARYDDEGKYWTLFSRRSGAKIRMSFTNLTMPAPSKAFSPELVDIKITDMCNFGCAYCYQGSTPEGKHADEGVLDGLAYSLGQMRVFECAIGGGEPTLHPKFAEFCDSLHHYGVVPNFTTRSTAWMKDAAMRDQLLKVIGGFAFSVDNAKTVEQLAKTMKACAIPTEKASVQYVMGCSPLPELEKIIRVAAKARIRVTLLGYKTTGRGDSFEPHDYSGWLDMLLRLKDSKEKDFHLPRTSIDTALASEYEEKLLTSGFPSWCFHVEEGTFSMYVDAVAKRVGRSSYVTTPEMIPNPLRTEDMLTQFKKWPSARSWKKPPTSWAHLTKEDNYYD